MFKAVMRNQRKIRKREAKNAWKNQEAEFRARWNDMTEEEYTKLKQAQATKEVRTFADAHVFMEKLRGLNLNEQTHGENQEDGSDLRGLSAQGAPSEEGETEQPPLQAEQQTNEKGEAQSSEEDRQDEATP